MHSSCSGNKTHVLPFLSSVFFPLIYSLPLQPSLSSPTFILRFQSTTFLHFSTCPMSLSGLRRPSSSPSPSPGINIILPSSSSHCTSVPPLTGGDLQAPVPIYQHNPPATNGWMPYNHGFGLPQGHANTVQFGNHGSLGRPGEYVMFSPP